MTPKYTLGHGSKRVYNSGLKLDIRTIIDTMLIVSPMDFTLVDGKRTAARQWELYTIGRRYKGTGKMKDRSNWELIPKGEKGFGIVTNCDGYDFPSNHQSGDAIDVQCYIPGRPNLAYDKIHLAVLIGAFLTTAEHLFADGAIHHRLRSGADWDGDTEYLEPGTFHDMPHLQLIHE